VIEENRERNREKRRQEGRRRTMWRRIKEEVERAR